MYHTTILLQYINILRTFQAIFAEVSDVVKGSILNFACQHFKDDGVGQGYRFIKTACHYGQTILTNRQLSNTKV